MKFLFGNFEHCELTTFAVSFGFAVIGMSIYFAVVDGVQFLSNMWAFIFTAGVLVGSIGIIWYTVEGKKSLVLPIGFFVIMLGVFLLAPIYHVQHDVVCLATPCPPLSEFSSLIGLLT